MPNILTSWKEIGQYLGKGVRTVQRWEREAGLPVRRNENHSKHSVLALPQELDDWARSRTRGPSAPLTDTLRKEIAALRNETMELSRRLDLLEEFGCTPARQQAKVARSARRPPAGEEPRSGADG